MLRQASTQAIDYLQLEGLYLASMDPPHVHLTTPVVESRSAVIVMVLPLILPSPAAVAIIFVPSQSTLETNLETWVAGMKLAAEGSEL